MLSTQRQNAIVGLGHIQRSKVRLRLYADVRVTVDGDIGNVVQQLVAAVQGFLEDKQLRCIINKVGSIIALDEVRVLQYVFQKLDIGFDAADTEFFQAAQHLGNCNLVSEAPGGSLNQQRIVVRSDDGAGEGVAAV